MENNENKNNKGLIVLIIVFALIVVGLSGLMIYDKVTSGKEEPTQEENISGDNSKDINNENKTISAESLKELEEAKNNLNNEYEKLYLNLIKNNGSFYLNKSVEIDNIESEDFLEYALGMFVIENDIDTTVDLECFEYGDCKIKSYDKKIIDQYIKNRFNTKRTFTLKNNDNEYGGGYLSSFDSFDLGDYIYDFKNQKYYFGSASRGAGYENIYRQFKGSIDNENVIYFYDTAIYCSDIANYACWASADEETYDTAIFELEDDNSEEAKWSDKEEIMILNEDYVFEKYSNKLNTYKHTFKKGNDGKYYWYSSEIVK